MTLKVGRPLRRLEHDERAHPWCILPRVRTSGVSPSLSSTYAPVPGPEDLYEFQQRLLDGVLVVEERRSQCSRVIKRLERGQALPADPIPPPRMGLPLLDVLRWIAAGCPDGVMADHSHKVTAQALQTRRLVPVSKRGGTWSATVTDVGHHYLQHGSFPPPGKSLRKPATTQRKPRARLEKPRRREDSSAEDVNRSTQRRPRLSPTEQLVADVVAAGSVWQVARDERRSGWWGADELVRNANRHGKTPAGQRLEHHVVFEGQGWAAPRFDLFTLVEGPAGTDAPLQQVPVPEHVERYHAAVSALCSQSAGRSRRPRRRAPCASCTP